MNQQMSCRSNKAFVTSEVLHAQALQDTVRAVRNARAEYGVDLGRRIPATILVADSSLRCARVLASKCTCTCVYELT